MVGEEAALGLATYVQGLGAATETALVDAFLARNFTGLFHLLPALFPDSGLAEQDISDLLHLANLTDSDINILVEVGTTSAPTLKKAQKVVGKIDFDNMPAISEKLDLLGIELTDLITNPGIFFEFFGDPEKSAILVDLQALLPKFRPADIETFLTLQGAVDEAQLRFGEEGAPPVMSKLFAIPIAEVTPTVTKLTSDADFQLLLGSGSALIEPAVMEALVANCTAQEFRVHYTDGERVGRLPVLPLINWDSYSCSSSSSPPPFPRTCAPGATCSWV